MKKYYFLLSLALSLTVTPLLASEDVKNLNTINIIEEKEKKSSQYVTDTELFQFVQDQFNKDENFSNDTRTKDINTILNRNVDFMRDVLKENKDGRKEESIQQMLKNIKDMETWVQAREEEKLYLNLREYAALADFLSITLSLDSWDKISDGRFNFFKDEDNYKLYGEEEYEKAKLERDYRYAWTKLFSFDVFEKVWKKAQIETAKTFKENPEEFFYEPGRQGTDTDSDWDYLILNAIYLPVISDTGIVDLTLMNRSIGFFDKNGNAHATVFSAVGTNKLVSYDEAPFTKNLSTCSLQNHDKAHIRRSGWGMYGHKKAPIDWDKKVKQFAIFNQELEKNKNTLMEEWFYNQFHESYYNHSQFLEDLPKYDSVNFEYIPYDTTFKKYNRDNEIKPTFQKIATIIQKLF